MRSDVRLFLDKNPDYWLFLREKPFWHRVLSVEQERIQDFVEDYKITRRKRFIDKVDDTSNILTLINAMME